MNTKHNFSKYTLLISLAVLSLIAAACAPAKPSPAPVVIKPTQAPTKALPAPTIAPTKPKPTVAPTIVPTVAPTTTTVANTSSIGTAETISDVSILPAKFELLPTSGSDKPSTGDQFLVVTLSLDNTSKTADFNFDPASMVILDSTGKVLPMVSLKSLSNELTTQILKPGAKLDGVVAFEIPQNEDKWTLEYNGTNNHTLMWSNAG
jgi:hypothetical protein